jgi:hypothetical protein
MGQQVITVNRDGSLEGLQVRSKDKGLDLRSFGKASINRYSDIVWNEEFQKWSIKILHGPLKDEFLTKEWHSLIVNKKFTYCDDVILFDEYEEAVAEEIKFYNCFKLFNSKLVSEN